MAKKCPPGKYYCFTDKKCKKIPRGYRIGARGYLARDTKDDDNETKKNGGILLLSSRRTPVKPRGLPLQCCYHCRLFLFVI